ncbi:MAG: cobalamin biosynthesis protein CbiX [Verrucomicrobia bacterium]|nr:cobalamin biosynthesis protein CbiX [Verrucomicrobiota bacterium]
MAHDEFADAALMLIGHGSVLNTDPAAPIRQHAEELRRRGVFAQVVEGFWKIEPKIGDVVHAVSAPRVFIVPVLISEGYFTEEVLPRELGLRSPDQTAFPRTQRRGGQTLFYCGPVGSHPRMAEVILDRAGAVVEQHPFPRAPKPTDTALFIAGHGTTENENSRKAIEHQAELLRARKLYAEVHAVFLEETPRIADCYQITSARHLVVVPFFISEGLHTRQDIPRLLGEAERIVQARLAAGQPAWRNPTERQGKLVWYAPSVGSDPLVAEVILERVREARGAEP